MTNTQYIGKVTSFSNNDKITPYLGYKVVQFLKDKKTGEISWHGPHHSEKLFPMSADSVCGRRKTCRNFEKCSCGFYAYKTAKEAINHGLNALTKASNHVVVQVALSGKVVIAEHGYRASHQRITRILFPSCWNCENAGDCIVTHISGYAVAACNDCVTMKGLTTAIPMPEFGRMHSPVGFSDIAVSSTADGSPKQIAYDFLESGKIAPSATTDDEVFSESIQFMLDSLTPGQLIIASDLLAKTMNRRMMDLFDES